MKYLKRIFISMLVFSLSIINIQRVDASSFKIRMSIYSATNITSSSSSGSGVFDAHAWIVIKNLGTNTITIGTQSLSKEQSCTIGLFGNVSPSGIWYNKEAVSRNQGEYQNNSYTVYYTKEITNSNSINQIVNVMKNNNYWNIFHNCAHFAVRVWNSVGGTQIDTSADPGALRSRIMSLSGYKTGINQDDFKNSKTNTSHYSTNAVTRVVTDEEFLNGKIIDGDRIILIRGEELVFLDNNKISNK